MRKIGLKLTRYTSFQDIYTILPRWLRLEEARVHGKGGVEPFLRDWRRGGARVLRDLPELCAAELLLLLDAPEICRLARLNYAYRGCGLRVGGRAAGEAQAPDGLRGGWRRRQRGKAAAAAAGREERDLRQALQACAFRWRDNALVKFLLLCNCGNFGKSKSRVCICYPPKLW
ncbi:hypothetical protein BRADI_2g39132v3 [Brachypodium distachyon]|uniref:F-box domain-containing protein n=1 Tax=Brachypodium distachyon TaxID=15368 RepID=A0A0Q3G946_BRADI|nr:hypothetical protein BRADI_2g39132v3 [Brachypodium distachyon]